MKVFGLNPKVYTRNRKGDTANILVKHDKVVSMFHEYTLGDLLM